MGGVPNQQQFYNVNLVMVYFIFDSAGFEILEDCPDVDVVIVPCGGGALLAGVASAVRLTGHDKCQIYGVEPEGGWLSITKP